MPFGFGGGRGRGRGGRGGGFGRRMGRGRGFMSGADHNCICPNCKTIVPHQRGIPCYQTICPNCGSPMTRQFGIGNTNPEIQGAQAPALTIPYVDAEVCTGCQRCLAFCPVGAIEMKDNKAIIDANSCNGCLVCISACPFGAIKVD